MSERAVIWKHIEYLEIGRLLYKFALQWRSKCPAVLYGHVRLRRALCHSWMVDFIILAIAVKQKCMENNSVMFLVFLFWFIIAGENTDQLCCANYSIYLTILNPSHPGDADSQCNEFFSVYCQCYSPEVTFAIVYFEKKSPSFFYISTVCFVSFEYCEFWRYFAPGCWIVLYPDSCYISMSCQRKVWTHVRSQILLMTRSVEGRTSSYQFFKLTCITLFPVRVV